jgi:hypothetical protein
VGVQRRPRLPRLTVLGTDRFGFRTYLRQERGHLAHIKHVVPFLEIVDDDDLNWTFRALPGEHPTNDDGNDREHGDVE